LFEKMRFCVFFSRSALLRYCGRRTLQSPMGAIIW